MVRAPYVKSVRQMNHCGVSAREQVSSEASSLWATVQDMIHQGFTFRTSAGKGLHRRASSESHLSCHFRKQLDDFGIGPSPTLARHRPGELARCPEWSWGPSW